MSHRTGADTSRRVIDIAIGILVGLEGCSEREAFGQLVDVVKQTGVGIGATAEALVALAGGDPCAQQTDAYVAWSELLSRARPVASSAVS